jgi:hypothetical protein
MFVADSTRNTSGVPLGTQYCSILLHVIIENTMCRSSEAFYLWRLHIAPTEQRTAVCKTNIIISMALVRKDQKMGVENQVNRKVKGRMPREGLQRKSFLFPLFQRDKKIVA